jgi:hypothetical protein
MTSSPRLVGGVQSGMGYLGAATLPELRNARRATCRVSPAGQKEAAPHDVVEIKTQIQGLTGSIFTVRPKSFFVCPAPASSPLQLSGNRG